MKQLLIKNANEIVTPLGFTAKNGSEMSQIKVIKSGYLLAEDGKIKALGSADDYEHIALDKDCVVIDAHGKIVLPGFVDSHTHFVFGGDRAEEFGWRLKGDDYMSIMKRGGGIANTVNATKNASSSELFDSGYKRLNSMMGFGVTTVEGKSGYGLDHDTEIKQLQVMKALNEKHPLEIISTYMGAHAIPETYKEVPDAYIDFMNEKVLPDIIAQELAEFCDVFCEEGVFTIAQSRKILEAALEKGLKVKIHADEIVELGGAVLAGELKAISADHLLMASNEGLEKMKENHTIATLLPGTAFSLNKPYARARYMIDSGLAVALASDFNPGSCYTESIPLIIALASIHMGMTIEEVITALTLNGAAAIGKADRLGSLDIGKQADIVIHDCPSYHFLPYHIGVNHVETVIKNGRIVLT